MNKIYLYILISVTILIFTGGLYLFLSRKNIKNHDVSPTVIPTNFPINEDRTIQPTLSQEEKDQIEADKEAGEWTKNLYDSYPWYNNLPLQSEKYFVYFDVYQKKFIATIYSPEEKDVLMNEIQSKLNDLNIDSSKYGINWEIKEPNSN